MYLWRTIETWYPLVEGLDPIRVTRSVPAIYILISQEKIDENEDGYASKFVTNEFKIFFIWISA